MRDYYSRQKGLIDNNTLSKKRVLVVGLGGLGGVVSNYLVRAGIGELIIVDDDVIEESNLNRQALFSEEDVGEKKALVAKEKLEKINKDVRIDARSTIFSDKLLGGVDLVFDCVDKYETKLEINKACFQHHVPLMFASANEFSGMLSLFVPGKTGCLSCLSKKAYESGLIVGPVAGTIGGLQAVEGLKYLCNKSDLLKNKLLHVDLLNHDYEIINIKRIENCSVCGNV